MKDLHTLQREIEVLRERLHSLVLAKGGFACETVTQLSIELDELIVAYEREKKATCSRKNDACDE
jgi:hypothetical protein